MGLPHTPACEPYNKTQNAACGNEPSLYGLVNVVMRRTRLNWLRSRRQRNMPAVSLPAGGSGRSPLWRLCGDRQSTYWRSTPPAPPPRRGAPIHDAAKAGDLQTIRGILADTPGTLDAPDKSGRTPLHLAAYLGHQNVVELLLEKGANKNATDRRGIRPIDAAMRRGHAHLAPLLAQEDIVQLASGVHRVRFTYGEQVNTLVLTGPDGVLVVDTGEVEVAPLLSDIVQRLGGGLPTIVINTHLHGGHTGGNPVLAKHARVINCDTLSNRVADGTLHRRPTPLVGRSGRSFDTVYTLPFNGREIQIIHAPGGHTLADLIVFLTGFHD